jgi:hypothetical protein
VYEAKYCVRRTLGCQEANSELKTAFWEWDVNIDDVFILILMESLLALGIIINTVRTSKFILPYPTERDKSIQHVSWQFYPIPEEVLWWRLFTKGLEISSVISERCRDKFQRTRISSVISERCRGEFLFCGLEILSGTSEKCRGVFHSDFEIDYLIFFDFITQQKAISCLTLTIMKRIICP